MSTYYQPRRYAPSVLDSTPEGSSLPVVVVGAGPVGLAVALGLATRGLEVTVLEADTAVSFGSRAICISRHSLEVADRLGFGEALTRRALPWVGGRSFYGDREVLRFQMPHDAHAVRPPMVNVSQSELEQIIVDAAEADPRITLHWGAPVTGLESYDDQVLLHVDTAAGPRTVRADWVVAADGGRSPLRELAGLRLQGTSYEGRYVIADICWQCDLPTERMVWFDPPSNPGSTVIMHRQPDDIWRIDYQLAPEDDAEAETTEEAIRARITKHLAWLADTVPGHDAAAAADWTLEWHGFYKAHALALDDFVHGRLVFTGDAAHLVPIFGVRGLNGGFEDADTLSWILAAVVAGDAGPELLDAYARERHAGWEQNIANAGKSTLIMTPGSDGYRTTRDALLGLAVDHPEFRHLIDPRQSSATHARSSVLTLAAARDDGLVPGDPLEDRAVLTAAGKESSLHDLRGAGFGVYAVAPVPADLPAIHAIRDRLAAALPRERVTTVLLGGTAVADAGEVLVTDAEGADGTAEAWGTAPGEVVVVRPDGLVLARGRVAALSAAGDELAERLAGRGEPVAGVPVPTTLTPEQDAREQVWLALSDALDATEDRQDLLARLALVLGTEAGPERLRTVLADLVGTR
ncbi:FAD-dependent oxidoreductase [Nocardioides sp. DS6]|uniref:FAD-dependent oxidoreductase n=1 Tax=Nocardioides eburneus TaxID=3231482 RepID=A0ABV3T2Q1_9ACTN